MLTKYCDFCEQPVVLTEEGYCSWCGKHADNMPELEDILGNNQPTVDFYETGTRSVEIDEFTEELLNEQEINKDLYAEE